MPYQPNMASTIQATLHMEMNGQTILNVLNYAPDETQTGNYDDGEAVLNEFRKVLDPGGSGWSYKQAVFSSTDLKFNSLKLQFIYPQRWAYKIYLPTNDEGTQAGTPAPQNVSAALTFQTDKAGRHEHGSIKVGGLVAGDVADGRVSNIIRGHIQSMGNYLTLLDPLDVYFTVYRLVILQRQNPAASSFVSHSTTGETVRVIRRRTVGLGI